MRLDKVGLKLFSNDTDTVSLTEYIPIFHRWIRDGVLPGPLVDVADYSHVHEGPGVLLIAHDGNYAVDESAGRRGVAFYRKRPGSFSALSEQLVSDARRLVGVGMKLAQDPELCGRVGYDARFVQVFVNDRLAAVNDDRGFERIEPAIRELASRLYPRGDWKVAREGGPQARLSVELSVESGQTLEALAERLAVAG